MGHAATAFALSESHGRARSGSARLHRRHHQKRTLFPLAANNEIRMSERYLANENFPAGVVHWLRGQGEDVVHAAETLATQPDSVILQTALDQDRILLTFDHDFGELVFRHRHPPAPGIVLFRLHQLAPDLLIMNLENFFTAKPILRGYFTVVSPGQFRQADLPAGVP